jgi:peptidoglycan/LPS O-acetylase OafA/YrhL
MKVELTDPVEPSRPARDGYFDLLRGFALFRVVTLHAVGASWIHLAFPAVGVMFGLAGSLMAASLGRRGSLQVVAARARRLLPPVWVYGAVAAAVGWEVIGSGESGWARALMWLFPLRDPHHSPAAAGLVDTLWYVRAYLWFVLLSPFMLWAFRRARSVTVLAPLVLLPAATLIGGSHWVGRGLLTSLLGYGTCWLLGFADHDGVLRRVRVRRCVVIGVLAGGIGLALVFSARPAAEGEPWAVTVGYAIWSAAWVMLLLRWRPDPAHLLRVACVNRLTAAVNARAVTIYLWHDPMVVAATALFGLVGLHLSGWLTLPVVLVLTAVAVLAVGWVEDLAARRPPRILPGAPGGVGRRASTAPGPAAS